MIKQLPPGATPAADFSITAPPPSQSSQVRAVGRGPDRANPRRYRHQPVAHAAGYRAGCGDPVSVRRQAAPDPDRPQFDGAAGARPVRSGRRQRARRAKPDHAGRHAKDRQFRIYHPAQQFAAAEGRARQSADQGRQTARWSISATSLTCATATRRRPILSMSTATARC